METWLIVLTTMLVIAATSALLGFWLIYSRRQVARALMRRVGGLPWRAKVQLAGELFRDPRVPLAMRIAMPLLVLYLIMPVDLIPDFIPIIGQIDDLALIILVAGLLLRAVPRRVIEEHIATIEEGTAAEAPATLYLSRGEPNES